MIDTIKVSPHIKIKFSEISIVVQGPVFNTNSNSVKQPITGRALNSIRKQFPGAELILSTWEGSDVEGLDYDILILSKDPGSEIRDEHHGYYHNVNRQIVSTMAGINAASRKYAMKTRSDVVFTHNKCVDYLFLFDKRSSDYRITEERVLVATISTVNPRRIQQLPYHPCDWFYFGLKKDLINIFDIPLFLEPEYTHWFKTREYPSNHPNFSSTSRYTAESYIWYSYCKKYLSINFDHLCDVSNDNIVISENIFANNLIVLNPQQLGIISLKKKLSHSYQYNMYTFKEWLMLYNKYCEGEFVRYFDWALLNYRISYRFNQILGRLKFRIRLLWSK